MIRSLHHAFPPFVLCMALAAAASAHAESVRKYGAWTVSCAADAYCTASSRLAARNAAYAYLLRVSRFASGAREIAFLAAAAAPATGEPIGVAIDTQKRFTLEAGSGYRHVSGGTFLLAQDLTDEMLAAMRKGRQITFTYTGAAGVRRQPTFALRGFSQALEAADIAVEPAAAGVGSTAAPAADVAATAAPEQSQPVQPPAERAPPAPPQAARSSPVQPEPARSAAARDAGVSETAAPAALPGPALEQVADTSRAPASPPPAGHKRVKAVQQFACRGNEPFWSLVVDRDTARYTAPANADSGPVTLTGKLRVTGEGRTPDVDWRGKAPDGSAYRVLIQQQTCADTMADAAGGEGVASFPYRAKLTLPGGNVVQGCCSAGLEVVRPASQQPSLDDVPVADVSSKPPGDWSRFLLELMPGIEACLARTPGTSPYATKAWPMNGGLIGVRTRNAVAGWFECVAAYDGRAIVRLDPVTAESGPLPGEGYVLYTPVSGQPLAGNCWHHERVVDFIGKTLGWLSTNRC